MNEKPESWKVLAVGPDGRASNGNDFGASLLYSFPTREEAEAHAECFRILMKGTLEAGMNLEDAHGCCPDKFVIPSHAAWLD